MGRQIFTQQLTELEQELLRMGGLVEEQIRRAMRALIDRDAVLAELVIAEDDRVDRMEMALERRCLTIIALQQPLAGDLRIVSTILKMITDLERIADHAVDIARVTKRMGTETFSKPLVDIPEMARLARVMVRQALNAFIHRSVEDALAMIRLDDEVDHLYSAVFRELVNMMRDEPVMAGQATYLLFVANFLERVSDHATNLGEWIIYMVTGERQELNN
ncbi:MAG: phosphate signaling complex protein PhoU [Firmicutes bacterium]|nr:phosphate signaling complex protein PhoU [Bacillota bacterium]